MLKRSELIIKDLERNKIIKKVKLTKTEQKEKRTRERTGYAFNKKYIYQIFLEEIITNSMPTEQDILSNKIARIPGVECIITTDIFSNKNLVDIVVSSITNNTKLLNNVICKVERELGRELKCTFLTTNDLIHRVKVNDKFIRDILEDNHTIHLDKAKIFNT